MFGSKKKESAAPAAVSAGASRAAGSAPEALTPEEAKKRTEATVRSALAFSQIVTVLMRSPHYRHYSLGDLEWLVLPPLLTGQCAVMEAKSNQNGATMPVGIALWASVSAEVDKKLSDSLNSPIRLRPDEWRSGDILWLVDAVGDGRVVSQFLKHLSDTTFKGRNVKVRARSEDGKPVVRTLQQEIARAAAASPAA